MVLNGVFRGAGDTVTPMNLSILSLILLIGLAYLFAFVLDFGYNGIWFAYPVSSLLTTIIAIFIYLKGDWKKIKLIHEHSSKENFGKGSSGKNSKLYNAA